jgi:glycosyltransferase involved in cell wall biosynthesis
MKVFFLTNLPAPYRALFFAELGKLCDLTVFYERNSASNRNDKWNAQTENTYRVIFLKGKKIGEDNSFCPEIIRYLSSDKYDKYIVGMYSTFTAMIAITYLKYHHIPFYLSTDGGFIQKDFALIYQIKRYFIGAASYWLCPCDMAVDYFVYYGAIRKKAYKYLFTSLTEHDIKVAYKMKQEGKQLLRKKLDMKEKYILLSVGRFSYEGGYGKGYDTLLSASMSFSDDIGVYIVGDEPTDEFLKWKEEKKLDHIHFVGFKEKQELAEYYTSADAFILLTRKDVWGLVINEAMSFCLPIITTKQCIAGLELVDDGVNGYLVNAGDIHASINAVNQVFANSYKTYLMGIESRRRIEEYTIENMAYTHFSLLNNIRE